MHVRRALLLFAIVLALAALATSISRPESDGEDPPPPPPPSGQAREQAVPGSASEDATEVRLPARPADRAVRVTLGTATTLVVPVPSDGLVELPGLGLSEPATPLAPARFELLLGSEGSYGVTFTPSASGSEERVIGRVLAEPG